MPGHGQRVLQVRSAPKESDFAVRVAGITTFFDPTHIEDAVGISDVKQSNKPRQLTNSRSFPPPSSVSLFADLCDPSRTDCAP